jgi:glutathione peroxidase
VIRQTDVNGVDAHPLFRFLRRRQPGFLGLGKIHWNFTKVCRLVAFLSDSCCAQFLVDKDGRPVRRSSALSSPLSLEPDIRRLLDLSDDAPTQVLAERHA